MKTNKEVIDALQDYFLTQDPKTMCRTLAALMIDMNRMMRLDELGVDERNNLLARMILNQEQLYKFIKDGPSGNVKLHNIESKDEQI